MELETYELSVTITRLNTTPEMFEWGICQELESTDGKTDFEFLAAGTEDSLQEAVERVLEEIKTLF